MENLEQLEKEIGYIFDRKSLLENAMTHSSYSNEKAKKVQSYERLEFLGDSVLGLIVSDYIFANFPNLPEGELTKLRASLVCEKQLCEFSKSMNFSNYIMLSHGERRTGGEMRPSILADVFEAVLAAIYLDSNIKNAESFVLKFIIPALNNPVTYTMKDYKTDLQEIVQKNPQETIRYETVKEVGPPHNKTFTVEVRISNNVLGTGTGRSKKDAEQVAAREALKMMGF